MSLLERRVHLLPEWIGNKKFISNSLAQITNQTLARRQFCAKVRNRLELELCATESAVDPLAHTDR